MLHKVLASLIALFTLVFCPTAFASSYGEVQLSPSYKTSYAACTGFFTTAGSATDVAILQGSASKTIKVVNVWLVQAGVPPGAVDAKYFLLKRSTANTAGTSTTATSVPLDSNNAAASVSGLKLYTANPTTGTLVGLISCNNIATNASSGVGNTSFINLYKTSPYTQAIVLRGTGEGLAVNFNGVTNPLNTSVSIGYEWTEE